MKIYFLIFALSLIQFSGISQSFFNELQNAASSSDFPLAKNIQELIDERGQITIDLYTQSQNPLALFIEQALLPVVNAKKEHINFNLNFIVWENEDGTYATPKGPDEVLENKRRLAIKNLYPDKYIDYILLKNQNYQDNYWQGIADLLGMDAQAIISEYSSATMEALFEQSVYLVDGNIEELNRPSIIVDGEPYLLLPESINFLLACCDFSQCMNNCTEFNWAYLGTVIYGSLACLACAEAPVPINPACAACAEVIPAITIGGLLDLLGCINKCHNDPCAEDGEVYCGPGEYCYKEISNLIPVPGSPQGVLEILNVACADCPKIEMFPFGREWFISPEEPLIYNWAGELVYQTETTYQYEFIKNGQIIKDGTTSNTTFFSFYSTHNNFETEIGDEYCIRYQGLNEMAECPPVEECFTVECPEITFVYENDNLKLKIEQNEISPFKVDFEIYEQSTQNQIDVGSTVGSFSAAYPYEFSEPVTVCLDLEVDDPDNLPDHWINFQTGNLFLCEDQICLDLDLCDLTENQLEIDPEQVIVQEESGANYNNGSIEIIGVINSTPPLDFVWDLGNGSATGSTITELGAGWYCVTVTDANDCTVEECFEVDMGSCSGFASCIDINVQLEANNATNENSNDGSIEVNAQGSSPHIYYWSDLNGASTSNLRENLTPGEYCVTVYDANCCSGEACITVNYECDLSALFQMENACAGQNDGEIEIFPQQGTPPYSVQWSNGSVSKQITGLSPGEYSVTVFDANNCEFVQSITVEEVPDDVEFLVDHVNAGIQIINPVNAPNILWEGPGITQENSSEMILTGLLPGEYCVEIETAEGCFRSGCTEIFETLELNVDFTPACPGQNNGIICIVVIGGSGDYSIEWDNGAMAPCILNGENGVEYTVTVTDNVTGETIGKTWTVPEYQSMTIGDMEIDHACPDQEDGSLCISVNGGRPPYSYSWSTGSSTSNCLNFLSGSTEYCVTVTDDCGITFVECIEFPEMDPITITNSSIDNICEGTSSGEIHVTVAGGSPPYSFNWVGPNNYSASTAVPFITELSDEGLYTVIITDVCGNLFLQSFTVEEFFEHMGAVWYGVTHVCDSENPDGELTITFGFNDDPPYNPPPDNVEEIVWHNGQTGQTISNLSPGTYWVDVFFDNGCRRTLFAYVKDYHIPLDDITIDTEASCPGEASGSVSIDLPNVPEDVEYTFDWSTGATTTAPMLSGLEVGNYDVTISNQFGCSEVVEFEIGPIVFIEIVVASITRPSSPNIDDGSIDIEVIGPGAPFTYQWSIGPTTQDIYQLSVGTYTVTVTDKTGNCSSSKSIQLDPCVGNENEPYPPAITLETVVQTLSSPNSSDGAIQLTVSGGTFPLYYTWTSTTDPEFEVYSIGTQTSGSLYNLPEGDYYVTVTDGCSSASTWRPIRHCGTHQIEIIEEGWDHNCPFVQGNRGYVDISVGGDAIGPLSYRWTKGNQLWATTQDISDLDIGGTYCVEVTDYTSCSVEQCWNIYTTYDIDESYDWEIPNVSCSFTYSCNGNFSETFTSDLDIILVNNDPVYPCQGIFMCPVDGTMDPNGTIHYGTELYTSSTPSGNSCIYTRVCFFDINDGIEIPISSITEDCCEEPECSDDDGDGIPDEYDEEDNNPCVPDTNNDNCTDTDGDGIPDTEDEDPNDPCVPDTNNENCDDPSTEDCEGTIEEIEYDYGCDIKVFCKVEGELTLLYEYDSPEVVPCRFFINYETGSCHDVRAWCPLSCSFEILEEYESMVYPEEEYSCDDTDLPTCEELHELCDGFVPPSPDASLILQYNENGKLESADWEVIDQKSYELTKLYTGNNAAKVYPNPFSKDLEIELSMLQEDNIKIEVYSLLGNKLFSKNSKGIKGLNKFSLPLGDYLENNGIFYLKINNSIGNISTHKIVHIN